MYPLTRLISTLLKARKKPKVQVNDTCEIQFRARPWDMDLFMEMNNGRQLTMYDLGRFDLSLRSNLAQVLKANNWSMVIAGSTVRYRRRIRMFEKITMRSRCVAYDERWVYIQQSMWIKDEAASSVLIRAGVTSKGRVIDTKQVRQALGMEHWQGADNPWLDSWKDSEALRPWPPSN